MLTPERLATSPMRSSVSMGTTEVSINSGAKSRVNRKVEVIPTRPVLAQSKPAGAAKSTLCSRVNALEMIKQQVEVTKSFNPVRRITVLIRAADLLLPYERDKARAVFAGAFELAIESEKEKASTAPRSVLMRMQTPD